MHRLIRLSSTSLALLLILYLCEDRVAEAGCCCGCCHCCPCCSCAPCCNPPLVIKLPRTCPCCCCCRPCCCCGCCGCGGGGRRRRRRSAAALFPLTKLPQLDEISKSEYDCSKCTTANTFCGSVSDTVVERQKRNSNASIVKITSTAAPIKATANTEFSKSPMRDLIPRHVKERFPPSRNLVNQAQPQTGYLSNIFGFSSMLTTPQPVPQPLVIFSEPLKTISTFLPELSSSIESPKLTTYHDKLSAPIFAVTEKLLDFDKCAEICKC